jgi:hypothetical protein
MQRLLAAARKCGFSENELWVRHDRSYTAEELVTSSMLWMSVTTPNKGEGGPTTGTRYDFAHACAECGTGALQTSPLVLNLPSPPRQSDAFETRTREFVISPRFAQGLERESVSGINQQLVVNPRGESIPWVQLLPQGTMPRLAESSRGILVEGACPTCGRDGRFHSSREPIELAYDDLDLDQVPDVAVTWECFGNSKRSADPLRSHFAQPLVLVKPKVLQVARDLNIRGLSFTPVRVVPSHPSQD